MKANIILIFQRTLPHYRLSTFNAIHKAIGAILCFGKSGPEKTFLSKAVPDFEHCRVRDLYPIPSKETLVYLDVVSPLLRYKPTIVITGFALGILSNWLLLFLRPFFRYKLILWFIGYHKKAGFHPEKSFKDRMRIWWMNEADAILLYEQKDKTLLSRYVKYPDKIFVAQNTLNTTDLLRIKDRLVQETKRRVKERIRFLCKYNLIFVGCLLRDKNPDFLLDVFKIVQQKINDVALHYVGNGPMMEELKIKSEQLKIDNVKFWGAIDDDERIGELLFASDLMVVPGYVGLCSVHSFCFDTPVCTRSDGIHGPFHGPEIEYVVDSKTGFLVPYREKEKMAEIIVNYLCDRKKQVYMRSRIKWVVKNVCNIDRMVEGFKKAVDYVRE